ncbi:hypothetical protein TNCT_719381 [Trichonephila clavata]|uniref:Uncharacterized protein n=1 Tax=Trichonephila clavata TaxID=2740835 RepID=A0A8X6FUQ0_TRICU|nr:hypothetical protein TNCT_719381 [Trichonephila clavata]
MEINGVDRAAISKDKCDFVYILKPDGGAYRSKRSRRTVDYRCGDQGKDMSRPLRGKEQVTGFEREPGEGRSFPVEEKMTTLKFLRLKKVK